jgi:hypothetical protein
LPLSKKEGVVTPVVGIVVTALASVATVVVVLASETVLCVVSVASDFLSFDLEQPVISIAPIKAATPIFLV